MSGGVVYVLFVSPAMAVPPVADVYQRYWPSTPPEADSVTVAGEHPLAPVVVGADGASSKSKSALLEICCAAKSPFTLQR